MKNRKNANNKQSGATLLEVLMVLGIAAFILILLITGFNYELHKQQRAKEGQNLKLMAKYTKLFATTFQTPLYMYSQNGNLYNGIITITPKTLANMGYINNSSYLMNIKNPIDGTPLYPCVVLFSNAPTNAGKSNNKLQGFIYYRTNGSNNYSASVVANAVKDMTASLSGIGGGIGTITNNGGSFTVAGNGYNWSVPSSAISQYLINQSNVDVSAWLPSPADNQCQGSNIASPAYIYYLGQEFSELSRPDISNSVDQYNNLNSVAYPTTGNNTNGFSMDATNVAGAAFQNVAQNKLVFQNNPNCQMNPAQLSTMMDYAPTWGSCTPGATNCNQPNPLGCRNKQLTIGNNTGVDIGACQPGDTNCYSGGTQNSLNAVVINGFTSNNTNNTAGMQSSTNLGGLTAYAYQPTAIVPYAQSCKAQDAGAMAQQDPKIFPTNMSTALVGFLQQNVSSLVCQKSVLCPNSLNATSIKQLGYCWLPINKMDIQINFKATDRVVAFHAPQGFFIKGQPTYVLSSDYTRANNPSGITYNGVNANDTVSEPINLSWGGGNGDNPYTKQDNGGNTCSFQECQSVLGVNVGCHSASGHLNVWNFTPTPDMSGAAFLDMNDFVGNGTTFTDLTQKMGGYSVWQQINGWNAITDVMVAGISANTYLGGAISPYTYFTGSGDQYNGATYCPNTCNANTPACKKGATPQCPNAYNWTNTANGSQFSFQQPGVFNVPIVANPAMLLYGTSWGVSFNGFYSTGPNQCDGYKNNNRTWLISDNYYITGIVISNDTSSIVMNASNTAPPPPSPPVYKPTITALAFNNQITCSGTQDTTDPTIFHGGTCSNTNIYSPNDYTSGLELQINSTAVVIASYSKVQNSNDWKVVMSKTFNVSTDPVDTMTAATAAGVSGSNALSYRYTTYSDNSCLPSPAQSPQTCSDVDIKTGAGIYTPSCSTTPIPPGSAFSCNQTSINNAVNSCSAIGGNFVWTGAVNVGTNSTSGTYVANNLCSYNVLCSLGANAGASAYKGNFTISLNTANPGPTSNNSCWLYNDSQRTSPHYTLRSVAP